MAQLKSSAAVTPIVALDVPDSTSARALVTMLGDHCDFYKVGLELFVAEGPSVVEWLRSEGKRVFLDLKLHDIPQTVRSAARSAAGHGASLVTVHASGGAEMIEAAVDGAREGDRGPDSSCDVLGVTILTSLDSGSIASAWGRRTLDIETEVVRLAGLVRAAGGRGIVCSGHEASAVRSAFGDGLDLLIPGIRLPGGDAHDQRRVMTPSDAAAAGARWLILGRAVTGAANPVEAMQVVHEALRPTG
ncbi:MAG: orotidine-5'-phosphate decarboxylase [Gemmatimonas sp.]